MKKRVLAGLLTICMAFCCAVPYTGCSKDGVRSDLLKAAPDYSAQTKQMSLYAYAPPGDGIYTVDGVAYQITDENGNPVSFQTVEKFTEYRDCGFDIIMFQADDPYRGEEFQTSHIKDLMDKAHEAGLKAIIFDKRLHDYSASESPIVGENCEFKSQEELESYVADCMKDYRNHPAFYGLLLRDEPNYRMLPALGAVIRAIRAVDPDCFAQCNLFPLANGQAQLYREGATENTVLSAYEWYVREFLRETGSDYVMFDSYPMTVSGGASMIKAEHLKGMQIVADICRELDKDFYMAIQSSSWMNNRERKTRPVLEEDLYWQWNLCLGMGVRQISYFTYQRKRTNVWSGEYFDDGTSFLSSSGERTPLYTWAKNVHEEMQKLVPVIFEFDYCGLSTYVSQPAPCNVGFLGGVRDDEFTMLEDVTISPSSVLLVTEMYDDEKQQYGYMVMNIADPDAASSVNAELAFSEADAVSVYGNGTNEVFALDEGKFSVELAPGRGVFVLPYSVQ